jgi:hypothetical protein
MLLLLRMHVPIVPANIFQQASGYCYGLDADEVLIVLVIKFFYLRYMFCCHHPCSFEIIVMSKLFLLG